MKAFLLEPHLHFVARPVVDRHALRIEHQRRGHSRATVILALNANAAEPMMKSRLHMPSLFYSCASAVAMK